MSEKFDIVDGNEAAADVAYRLSEVVAIYPITPSSTMGEWADEWAAQGRANLWGDVPMVMEMQSEAGVAGALHGALQAGSLGTTFTASQGLLLMIPGMYKIAGELTPVVIHVAARSLAAHALSIFGDHSDVMAARATGFAFLCSNSIQEAADLALIATAASLESRVSFCHFFDGFRTSHEVQKMQPLSDELLRSLVDETLVTAHRARALTPDRPSLRGTAQNPDVFFQSREAANPFYEACPDIVQGLMDRFAELTGRAYRLYEYHGAPDAERVVILMGSGCETVSETVDALNARGEKVGVLKVRLFRPFDARRFCAALPPTVKKAAVLDRTKEPGSAGEPLFLDTAFALRQAGRDISAIGGRYGLSSKEFTPAMAKAVFDELASKAPKTRFTLGIDDDVTETSLAYDPAFSLEPGDVIRAVFFGLGADGTVGANKSTIKIIGEGTDSYVQAYFVYDSKKSGAMTVSHLRFGPRPIRAPYLIEQANFVACHQASLVARQNMLGCLAPGGVFLLNTPAAPSDAWRALPRDWQEQMVLKKLRFFVIDGHKVARDNGLGGRINTVMQACFFAISGVLPRDRAMEAIRDSIRKTYGKKGDALVERNLRAVDDCLPRLSEVEVPQDKEALSPAVPGAGACDMPPFVRDVLRRIGAGEGDCLPVSAFPPDGVYPTGTARFEKRSLAADLPVWEPAACIQCAKCVMVCPHSAIRQKLAEPRALEQGPDAFKSAPPVERDWDGLLYTLQVAPQDCTGCGICVDVCPARDKATGRKALELAPASVLRETEKEDWDFFLSLPEVDRSRLKAGSVRQEQFQRPLFEFSGACSGCGETPYLKLLSQLYGDRLLIANATGCSSIFGGNLPTTPWTKDGAGRGPAWSNSLFEDNAEFGLGMRLSVDQQRLCALALLRQLEPQLGAQAVSDLAEAAQKDEAAIAEQRRRVETLKVRLKTLPEDPRAARLLTLVDTLVRKSVWIVGGDGWAYDIGFGGLDHVLASGRNVKVLVLDTEVYSNTGGQKSKSTPRGAVAKFSTGGNAARKKDLGLMAMSYGNVYVASVAMGAKDEHTLKAFLEAEAYDGPSLIIAYSHCIAHGIDMGGGMRNQKAAVETGKWLLYRYNPERALKGQAPLTLDAKPTRPQGLGEHMASEGRFSMLSRSHPEEAKTLFAMAEQDARLRWDLYEHLSRQGSTPPKS